MVLLTCEGQEDGDLDRARVEERRGGGERTDIYPGEDSDGLDGFES